ncbi:hypothetical protein T484DRAFT_1979134 [Baffinella frigidus]|nr:hypothetical protein T484DRAFT_1979134 [Cryptophyta sp. CCMP2293]|mmetsp:Transcript_31755/g.72735  ORF Transcript_31755/g.72735 Transcript_31755/m.72735 type:complete len:222 (+) Transcript_31755:178-843(+)
MGLGEMRAGSWRALMRCTSWQCGSRKDAVEFGRVLEGHGDDDAPCLNREYSGASTASGKSRRESHSVPMAVCVAIPTGRAAAMHLPVAKAVVVMSEMLSDWLLDLERPEDTILRAAIEERQRDIAARPPIAAEIGGDTSSHMSGSLNPSADDSIDEFFASTRHHGHGSFSWRPGATQQAQAHATEAPSHAIPEGGMPDNRGEKAPGSGWGGDPFGGVCSPG